MDNRPYSNNAYTIDRDADYPEINIVIDTMELYEKQKFSLHYDFGDDWMFTIDVVKIVSVEKIILNRMLLVQKEKLNNIDKAQSK